VADPYQRIQLLADRLAFEAEHLVAYPAGQRQHCHGALVRASLTWSTAPPEGGQGSITAIGPLALCTSFSPVGIQAARQAAGQLG
jgi:hypothetical protein